MASRPTAHRKLRELIKTPLLQLEHLRGLEGHVDFIEARATDFVRGDPDYDGGVTGTMKIAHAAEGFGLDIELHAAGPVRRHLMAAIRNTNYYEMGLLHPKVAPFHPPVYADGYEDAIDSIDEKGCVEIPDGPGLGVEYDWDFIPEEPDRRRRLRVTPSGDDESGRLRCAALLPLRPFPLANAPHPPQDDTNQCHCHRRQAPMRRAGDRRYKPEHVHRRRTVSWPDPKLTVEVAPPAFEAACRGHSAGVSSAR